MASGVAALGLRMVLASASPRRLDLLRQIGLAPAAIDPADIEEVPARGELPVAFARRCARAKALAVSARHQGAVIVACDTVVACGRRIMPKATTLEAAGACLRFLSGRRHRVHGAVVVMGPGQDIRSRLVTTLVSFKRLSQREIAEYLALGEWEGKAGGYAIQGRAALFVRAISGSYSNVVGLPLFETGALLGSVGIGQIVPAGGE